MWCADKVTSEPDLTPGPNAYDPKEPLASYKKGAMFERDSRFRMPSNQLHTAEGGFAQSNGEASSSRAVSSGLHAKASNDKEKARVEMRLHKAEEKVEDLLRERAELYNERADAQTELSKCKISPKKHLME